jgi:peroxiredoxin
MMLQPGEKAPDFTLPDQHGTPVKLSDLRGRTVVLCFYPKAETLGPKAVAGIRPWDCNQAITFPDSTGSDDVHELWTAFGRNRMLRGSRIA